MEHADFDKALLASAFEIAGARGWPNLTIADAARAAGLPLVEARRRFPSRGALLMKLGRSADEAALAAAEGDPDGTPRDRLFGIVMSRIDVFQAHRAGVLALFRALPAEPLTTLALWAATLRSMAWLLDGAGISPTGLDRTMRAHGLALVWLSVLRAWMKDEGADLSSTMAALDRALDRAEQVSGWFGGRPAAPPRDEMVGDVPVVDVSMEDVPFEDAAATSDLPRTTPPPPPDGPASPPN